MSEKVKVTIKWIAELAVEIEGTVKEASMIAAEHLCDLSGELNMDIKSKQFVGNVKSNVRLPSASILPEVERQITKALEQDKMFQDYQRFDAIAEQFHKYEAYMKETYPMVPPPRPSPAPTWTPNRKAVAEQPSSPIPESNSLSEPSPAPTLKKKKAVPEKAKQPKTKPPPKKVPKKPTRRETRSMRRDKSPLRYSEQEPECLDDDNSADDSGAVSSSEGSPSGSESESDVVNFVDEIEESEEVPSQESYGRENVPVASHGEQFMSMKADFELFAKSSIWLESEELWVEQWRKNNFLKSAFDLMLLVWQRGQQSPNKPYTRETLWTWIKRQFSDETWHTIKDIAPPHAEGICVACQTRKPLSVRLTIVCGEPEHGTEDFGSCCGAGLTIVYDLLHWIHWMLDEKRRAKKDKKSVTQSRVDVWWGDFTVRMDNMQTFLTKN
jgi:hypothetical protein